MRLCQWVVSFRREASLTVSHLSRASACIAISAPIRSVRSLSSASGGELSGSWRGAVGSAVVLVLVGKAVAFVSLVVVVSCGSLLDVWPCCRLPWRSRVIGRLALEGRRSHVRVHEGIGRGSPIICTHAACASSLRIEGARTDGSPVTPRASVVCLTCVSMAVARAMPAKAWLPLARPPKSVSIRRAARQWGALFVGIDLVPRSPAQLCASAGLATPAASHGGAIATSPAPSSSSIAAA